MCTAAQPPSLRLLVREMGTRVTHPTASKTQAAWHSPPHTPQPQGPEGTSASRSSSWASTPRTLPWHPSSPPHSAPIARHTPASVQEAAARLSPTKPPSSGRAAAASAPVGSAAASTGQGPGGRRCEHPDSSLTRPVSAFQGL